MKELKDGWIGTVRPSRQPRCGFLRMRGFLNAINKVRHGEERRRRVSNHARRPCRTRPSFRDQFLHTLFRREDGRLIPPLHAFRPHFVDQRRIGLPQIDEIDIVRDRAFLDIRSQLAEEAGTKIVPRQDRDVAALPWLARAQEPNSHTAASCSPSAASTICVTA
jgi:hypothetical protein